MRDYDISSSEAKPNCFVLSKENLRSYYIQAPDQSTQIRWMEVLRQSSSSSGTEGLDSSCISPLIGLVFYSGSEHINQQAGQILAQFFEDSAMDGHIIHYMKNPLAFKPLKKLLSCELPVAIRPLSAVCEKLAQLTLVEDVCKCLIAQGIHECLYIHFKPNGTRNVQTVIESVCKMLSSMTRFDFFPCSPSLKSIFALIDETSSDLQRHLAVIVRNLATKIEFRKLTLESHGLEAIVRGLRSQDGATLQKFVQAIYLLLSKDPSCLYTGGLLKQTAVLASSVDILVPLILHPFANLSLFTLKTLNAILSSEPTLVEKVQINSVPPVLNLFFEANPESFNLFELTRFLTIISRNSRFS
jgi:hypothetical protein